MGSINGCEDDVGQIGGLEFRNKKQHIKFEPPNYFGVI